MEKTGSKASLFNKPYNLFLFTSLVLFICSFFIKEQSQDINLHDTYIVISTSYIFKGLAIIFLLGWMLYKVTNKYLLNIYLTWFHVLTTIVILILFITANFWHDKLLPPAKRKFVSWQTLEEDQYREMKIYLPIIIIFIAAQVAYITNLLGGIIKPKH